MVNKDELAIKIKKIEENFLNMFEDLKSSLDIEENQSNDENLLFDKLEQIKHDSQEEFIQVMNETNPKESKEEIYYKNKAKKLLGIELEKLKLKENFKLKELGKLITNLGLGKFNKQKFNKFVRECIIPKPKKQEKNQYLYDKSHIPYAILVQCFETLDTTEFHGLLSLVNQQEPKEDIYTSYNDYINRDEDVYYCNMDNINDFTISVYLDFFSYKNTQEKDIKNQNQYLLSIMDDTFKKLLEPLENNKDLSKEEINFYIKDIKAYAFVIKLITFNSVVNSVLEIKNSIIDDIINFND